MQINGSQSMRRPRRRKVDPSRLREWMLQRYLEAEGRPAPLSSDLAAQAMAAGGPLEAVASKDAADSHVSAQRVEMEADGVIAIERAPDNRWRIHVLLPEGVVRTDWAVVKATSRKPQEDAGPRAHFREPAARAGQLVAPLRSIQPRGITIPHDSCLPRAITTTAMIADMRQRGIDDARICHGLGLDRRSLAAFDRQPLEL